MWYKFKHHDALEDAKASGQIILEAIQKSRLDLDSWLKRVKQPIDPSKSSNSSDIKKEGNPGGDLYGEVIVFTGALKISRRNAADLAASAGCSVDSGVTKKTTILVLGEQDLIKISWEKEKF